MLAFARVALLRLVRDRTNVFFIVLFPLLLVMLIGLQFSSGGSASVGLVAGADADLASSLRERLLASDVAVEVEDLPDEQAARDAVEASDVDAAVVLPDEPVTLAGSGTAEVGFIANPDGSDQAVRAVVRAAVSDLEAPLRAQRALLSAGVTGDPGQAADLVAAASAPGPTVATTTVGDEGLAAEFAGLGQFDLGASTQLLLFVFITAMTGSAAVVQSRRWGILDRVLVGPTAPSTVVLGLGLGQLAVAGVQALVIVAATTLLFGVDWGDPLASTAVVVLFSVVAAAAGLLLGALLRNEEQAGGVGVPMSLGLAALGGCMVPLELFPPALQTVARFTPHAWGNLAFADIVRRGGTITDVLPELGMLLLFAVLFGGAAAAALRARMGIES